MSGSKLIDLRDCQEPEYQRIYLEMERIRQKMHGFLARWLFSVMGKRHLLLFDCWSRQWEYPWAILNADLHPGLIVLDAGCGGSPLLSYLASGKNLSLYGVDKGRDPVTWTGKLLKVIGYISMWGSYPDIDHRVHFSQEPLEKMSFADGFIDRVFCISVIEHIPIGLQSQAMREMSRVLKRGGRLIMTMDLPRDDPHAADNVVQASGLQLLGSLDYSVDRAIRHGHTYEVGGLILEKQ